MTSQTYAYGVRWRYERDHGVTRLVDPVATTEHIHALEAEGWSQRAIADAAGCAVQTVCRLSKRQQPKVHRDSAHKILAVTSNAIRNRSNPDGFVLKVGAQRRIQALLAIGHRHEDISAAMRRAKPDLGTVSQMVLHQVGRWVFRSTHDAVCAAYDELAMTPGRSERTRGRALRLGYAPPLAWDDDEIDDPYAEPDRSTDTAQPAHRALPPLEDLEFLLDNGESIATIALRFGVSEGGVFKALGRNPAA